MNKEYRLRFHRLISQGAKLTENEETNKHLKNECLRYLRKVLKYLAEKTTDEELLSMCEEEEFDPDKINWKTLTPLDIYKEAPK